MRLHSRALRLPRSPLVAGLLGTFLFAACTTAGGASPLPSASPPIETPRPGFSLRAWLTQALAPAQTFAWLPQLAIVEGLAITPGPVIAIYPGPLLPPLLARSIDERGIAEVVEAARAAGLLGERTDFTGGTTLLGAQVAHLELVVDGVRRELVGDPTRLVRCDPGARCIPSPGTPEAFAAFWARLADLPGWLDGALGPEATYSPLRLAVLVTEPAPESPPLSSSRVAWPLPVPLAEFGGPFAGTAGDRCGTVSGEELALLLPRVREANTLTRWVDATGLERSLVVRPLVPGEPDPCGPGA